MDFTTWSQDDDFLSALRSFDTRVLGAVRPGLRKRAMHLLEMESAAITQFMATTYRFTDDLTMPLDLGAGLTSYQATIGDEVVHSLDVPYFSSTEFWNTGTAATTNTAESITTQYADASTLSLAANPPQTVSLSDVGRRQDASQSSEMQWISQHPASTESPSKSRKSQGGSGGAVLTSASTSKTARRTIDTNSNNNNNNNSAAAGATATNFSNTSH